MKYKIAALMATVAVVLAGCGGFSEANNYKTPDPKNNSTAHWIRIDTPSNYETVIWACVGQDAVFIGQSSGLTVSTYDPNCGATSQVVGTK